VLGRLFLLSLLPSPLLTPHSFLCPGGHASNRVQERRKVRGDCHGETGRVGNVSLTADEQLYIRSTAITQRSFCLHRARPKWIEAGLNLTRRIRPTAPATALLGILRPMCNFRRWALSSVFWAESCRLGPLHFATRDVRRGAQSVLTADMPIRGPRVRGSRAP
jgi:hypothetical protein